MGLMPPYDPFTDTALAWALVEAIEATPPTATWSAPSQVRFRTLEVLAGSVSESFVVSFGQPREAGQSYFYAQRGMHPIAPGDEAANAELRRRTESLDHTPVELPELRVPVVVWLSGTGERLDIPTLRTFGNWPFEHHARFIPGTPENVVAVKVRLRR